MSVTEARIAMILVIFNKIALNKNFGVVHVARNIVIINKIALNRKISEQ